MVGVGSIRTKGSGKSQSLFSPGGQDHALFASCIILEFMMSDFKHEIFLSTDAQTVLFLNSFLLYSSFLLIAIPLINFILRRFIFQC